MLIQTGYPSLRHGYDFFCFNLMITSKSGSFEKKLFYCFHGQGKHFINFINLKFIKINIINRRCKFGKLMFRAVTRADPFAGANYKVLRASTKVEARDVRLIHHGG